MLDILLATLIKRPYVFAFLISYLFLSTRSRGFKRTLSFLFMGYGIAWASEALSIRTGFPYGWYFYIYENLQGEWLNFGVPVWDSVSYVFLCYAGMMTARYLVPDSSVKKQVILGAVLVVVLDIVVDPLSHLGNLWFLGKIYYYPNPGFYFDVPLSNFIGWFFVTLLIIGIDAWTDKRKAAPSVLDASLYFSVFLFNWGITLWIGQYFLAFMDLLWMAPIAYFFWGKSKRNLIQ